MHAKSFQSWRLFATLWTIVHQAPLSMGFSRQEYRSGLPFPSPGHLPDPGVKLWSPISQADSLASEPPEKPQCLVSSTQNSRGMASILWEQSIWDSFQRSKFVAQALTTAGRRSRGHGCSQGGWKEGAGMKGQCKSDSLPQEGAQHWPSATLACLHDVLGRGLPLLMQR